MTLESQAFLDLTALEAGLASRADPPKTTAEDGRLLKQIQAFTAR